ncbi:MAG TPA: glutamate racemase, partial [Candidatus Binatia bacterium]
RALKQIDPKVEVYSRACPLFVPLVEEGWLDNEVVEKTVESYLGSLKRSGIDTLILGCTHYPLLKKAIRRFMGRDVRLVDSAEETANEVSRLLEKKSLQRERGKGGASFFVTDVPDRFIKVGRRFLGEKVDSAVRIER